MEESSGKRVWFITGANGGFGRALIKEAVGRGDTVIAAARAPERLNDLAQEFPTTFEAIELDVTDRIAAGQAITDTYARYGRIDVLVNNAGHTHAGAAEETSEADLRDLMEVHFHGPVALTTAALPGMRKRRSGCIVQIGSVCSQAAIPGLSGYGAAKAALEAWSAALSLEVRDLGISVLIVEPKSFKTGILAPGSARISEPIADYAGSVGPTRHHFSSSHGNQPGDPARAAAIIASATHGSLPERLVVGEDALEDVLKHIFAMTSAIRTSRDAAARHRSSSHFPGNMPQTA